MIHHYSLDLSWCKMTALMTFVVNSASIRSHDVCLYLSSLGYKLHHPAFSALMSTSSKNCLTDEFNCTPVDVNVGQRLMWTFSVCVSVWVVPPALAAEPLGYISLQQPLQQIFELCSERVWQLHILQDREGREGNKEERRSVWKQINVFCTHYSITTVQGISKACQYEFVSLCLTQCATRQDQKETSIMSNLS